MTIYQKAIKVRKECKAQTECIKCSYKDNCLNSNIVTLVPIFENLKVIAKAIVIEKWNVK